MQKISDDLNKIKRSFLCGPRLKDAETKLLQAINCEKNLRSGFPLRIHQLTTTRHAKPITTGRPSGSSKGLSTMNGRRQVPSCGPTGIVQVSINYPPSPLMVSCFVAGSGKSILWWVTSQLTCVIVAYIGGDQFFDHKGH
jgi:hypothetical protein